ncbi:MAG: ROK family protein [Clostridia bacterium]|nr:ROK family protein [Clostridium sp.]MBS6251944.1 ROK family protein [Clostridium sp.]
MKIGVDLGGSHIAIGAVDNNGKVIEKFEKRITKTEKKNIKKTIEEYIIEKTKMLQEKYKITSIGIAVPGTIENGVILKSVNLELKNYPLLDKLKENINIPIKIKNDTKCAAIAENIYGALREYNSGIFLTLGTGIGGAIIINNKLLEVGELPGCEFGHMIIQKNGLQCNCGKKGCFEKYASMKAFKDNLRNVLNLDEKTSGKDLLDIIRRNPQGSENFNKINKVIEEYIDNLSIGISNLINIFESEAVVIGGSFVFYEEIFMNKLKEKILNNSLLFNQRKEIIIQTAILGNDAGLIGSTLL